MSKSEASMTKQEEMLENTHKIFSYVRNAEYDGVDAMLDEGVVSMRLIMAIRHYK